MLPHSAFYSCSDVQRFFCCVSVFYCLRDLCVIFFTFSLHLEEDFSVHLHCVHNCLFAFLIHHRRRCHRNISIKCLYMFGTLCKSIKLLLSSMEKKKMRKLFAFSIFHSISTSQHQHTTRVC